MRYSKRFMNPEAVRRYEDLYSDANSFDSIVWLFEQEFIRSILVSFVSPTMHSALDFACGTGRVTRFLEHFFTDVYGVDISPAMTEICSRSVTKAKILTGDIIHDDDLLPGPFDLITAFRFFLNIEESLRKDALIALRKRMHESSILILNIHGSFPSLRSLSIRLHHILSKIRPKDMLLNEIKKKTFESLATKCGFEIVCRRGLAILTPRVSALLGARLTQYVENVAYISRLADLVGSDQIYVLKRQP